jgi:hypothetical protein
MPTHNVYLVQSWNELKNNEILEVHKIFRILSIKGFDLVGDSITAPTKGG